MTDQVLKDKNNRILGRLKTLSSGKIEARTPTNKLVGVYDPKADTTRDPNNRIVGKGNLLAALLPPL